MSAEKLFADQAEVASRVLAAWFDDARFRAAWVPEPALFVTEQQIAVAEICAAKGPETTRDQLVFLMSRSTRWKRLAANAAEIYAVIEGPVVLDPWRALERLRELSATRALRQKLQETLISVDGGTGLLEARGLVTSALNESAVGSGVKVRTIKQVMTSAFVEVAKPSKDAGFRTISKSLDFATGGLRRRKVWVVAAATSWGKSSFLVALERQLRADGRRVLIVSGEDEEQLFGERMLAAASGANAIRMRDHRLTPFELRNASGAVEDAGETSFFLDVNGMPAEKVAADVRSICIAEAIDFVAIDYLQVFRMQKRSERESRRDELWNIARLYKETIKAVDAAGMLFSQITEDEKTGKRKTRDAEDIEHLADVCAFGTSEATQELGKDGKPGVKSEKKALFLKKVKNGPKGFTVPLDWDRESASFGSAYYDPRVATDLPYEPEEYQA
jgi:hypothetical protein